MDLCRFWSFQSEKKLSSNQRVPIRIWSNNKRISNVWDWMHVNVRLWSHHYKICEPIICDAMILQMYFRRLFCFYCWYSVFHYAQQTNRQNNRNNEIRLSCMKSGDWNGYKWKRIWWQSVWSYTAIEREEEKKNNIRKECSFFKRKRCCGNSIGQIVNK